jgi:hypothetical protein
MRKQKARMGKGHAQGPGVDDSAPMIRNFRARKRWDLVVLSWPVLPPLRLPHLCGTTGNTCDTECMIQTLCKALLDIAWSNSWCSMSSVFAYADSLSAIWYPVLCPMWNVGLPCPLGFSCFSQWEVWRPKGRSRVKSMLLCKGSLAVGLLPAGCLPAWQVIAPIIKTQLLWRWKIHTCLVPLQV